MTALPAGSALAGALARGRARYNAKIALARRRAPLDLSRLARHLADGVAPAVEAAARAAPGREDAVCEALFELSLELVARDVLGAEGRHPEVNVAWRELLPRVGTLLAQAPRRVAAAITNAAANLEALPGVRAAEWRAALGALAPACPDVRTLLACGQVLAWRAGAAHWRASALRIWEELPDALAGATLGVPPEVSATRDELRGALADPFRRPGAPATAPALRVIGRVGGFRGFGGPFLAPPDLACDGGRLWALDGEDAYTIHADAFGRTVVRTPGPPSRGGPRARLGRDGTLALGGLTARFPELAGARAATATETLAAVLPPHTHLVVLVARTGAEGR